MPKISKFLLQILIVSVLYSCATTAPKDVPIIYPQPPEEPKIVYLKSYRGTSDYVKPGFLDIIFGYQPKSDLVKPYGVASSGDKIYVSLTGSPSICVIDTREQKVSYIGDRGSGKLSLPVGVAVTWDGMLFVSDAKLKRVFGYTLKGDLHTAIGQKGELNNPGGIAVNEENRRLYVVDSYDHKVRVFTLQGEPLFEFGQRGAGNGEFNFPSNVAIDRRKGTVYVVDSQNFRVQAFDKDGKFLRKFGELGDQPGNFARPKGVGVDSEGHVYVTDAAFENFQVFDENGQLLLYIGGPGTEGGYFQLPAGMYIDAEDRIFVVDSLNQRVQMFQYLSEQWKKRNPDEYEKYRFKQANEPQSGKGN